MKLTKTERNFNIVEFVDRYDAKCSLQKSSLAFEDCIWLGITNPEIKILASKLTEGGRGWVKYPVHPDAQVNGRMHLTREQVKELLPYLQNFVDTGELTNDI